jgi:hypothetical protein
MFISNAQEYVSTTYVNTVNIFVSVFPEEKKDFLTTFFVPLCYNITNKDQKCQCEMFKMTIWYLVCKNL